jgi:hypothetical protein
MSDWLHALPVVWMALMVFGATYLVAAGIYFAVSRLAAGGRARSFKAVSPGMLPPLGIVFGLFVAFIAAQVWNDNERAEAAVNREASALRTAVVLSSDFAEAGERLRRLIRAHIKETIIEEWPKLAHQSATLSFTPPFLAQALQLTLSLTPDNDGQRVAQREIAAAIGNAFDARLQRIIISRSQVNAVKWACLILQAICALTAIAMVHSDDRLSGAITMTIFATGIGASVLLIAAHDRPFVGEIAVGPGPLHEVMPESVPVEKKS